MSAHRCVLGALRLGTTRSPTRGVAIESGQLGLSLREPLLSVEPPLDPLGSASCAAELLVAAHLPHSHLTPSKPGRRPNGNNFEPVPRRVGRVADRRRSAMVRSFLSYILIPHSEQAGAWQVDADDVHGAVARFERGAVAGVDGAAIVPDGAAARGDADPEPQAVARVRTPAVWSAAREHGEVEGCACGCSYVHCRETHVRLTSDGGEANEMLLFHGTGATKPQARAELRGGSRRLQRAGPTA